MKAYHNFDPKRSYRFSAERLVPSEQELFIQQGAGGFRQKLKFYRRYLYLWAQQQIPLERELIPHSARRILYINLTAPSLGDSLMDLAGRSLFSDLSQLRAAPTPALDLLTDPRNAELYKHDRVFGKVFTVPKQLSSAPAYDFVLLDSYSPRSVKIKALYFPKLEFAGIYGFLNGYEVHRTLFSYQRFNELLGLRLSRTEIEQRARPLLYLAPENRITVPSEKYIAIVIGGEWEFRCYKYWGEVIKGLQASNLTSKLKIVLLGSANGRAEAEELVLFYPNLINYVGKLSLTETAVLIAGARVQLSADGGLWHVASALGVPTVALFASKNLLLDGRRHLYDTPALKCVALYHESSVSAISPQEVINAYYKIAPRACP